MTLFLYQGIILEDYDMITLALALSQFPNNIYYLYIHRLILDNLFLYKLNVQQLND